MQFCLQWLTFWKPGYPVTSTIFWQIRHTDRPSDLALLLSLGSTKRFSCWNQRHSFYCRTTLLRMIIRQKKKFFKHLKKAFIFISFSILKGYHELLETSDQTKISYLTWTGKTRYLCSRKNHFSLVKIETKTKTVPS